jgi:threonine dehydrogenase-like Zn-dependent dehydrogenase
VTGARTVRALVVDAPGRAVVREVPDPALGPGGFRVTTLASGVSMGTELTWYRGTNPALHSSFDAALGLFRPGAPAQGYPVERFGYMQVGRVEASRFPPVPEGARVAMTYGHRTGHTTGAGGGLAERAVVLPEHLPDRLATLVAHLGPICANGLLHAAHDAVGPAGVRDLGDGVRGRCVVVVGAGLVGLVTAVFASHHGAAQVLVLDETPARLAAARALGLATLPAAQGVGPEAAVAVKERFAHAAGDRGADVVLQCRGRTSALALALACLRPQGTVVDLAFYDGGADAVRLGEEFHHGGLSIRCAQIGRVPRGLAHTWDRERLSRETLDLLADRGGDLGAHVLTDDVPFEQAPALLDDVSARRRQAIGVVLQP